MKKILVPIDFSNQAEYAAKVAAKIAEETNSELHLLHMLELPTEVIDPSNFGAENNSPSTLLYMKRAQEKFEKLTKRYYLRNVKVVKSVFFHETFDGIIKESQKQNADLIVMGSQGVSGFEEMFVGSNTEKVVRHSDVPVLVIKNEIDDFKLENLVFASNFDEDGLKTFTNIVSFAKIFNAKIHLLKVNTAQSFEPTIKSQLKIKEFVNHSDLKNYTINIHNDVTVEMGILNFAEYIEADVIALNTHGRRGLMSFFSGSISKDISNHSVLPVITFKLK
ncbi:universal stress protein [Urechidicola vernalis]|uniref:Universal stress protein n=1 Tax=Urechidicola vernalis TaxID=3075600 RepID=A0ABU2Y471_9FLAO|nr:universal stress protein [Urechidicola sp. P050]MDT0552965.1 universal stress protein [Urechidicola sp. P050]